MPRTGITLAIVLLAIVAATIALFSGRAPEAVELATAAEGWSAAEGAAPVRSSGAIDVALREHEREVAASEGAPEDVDAAEERGRVDVVVVVRNEAGVAVEGVDVVAEVLNKDEERSLSRFDRKGITDSQGRCPLRLFDGPFVVGANRRESLPTLTSESQMVEIGVEPTEVQVALRRKAASLIVVCVDDRGAPIERVKVELLPDDLEAFTGPDGRAQFDALPVGRHELDLGHFTRFAVPSRASRVVDLAVGAREIVRYELPRVGSLTVRCVPPPPISDRAEPLLLPREDRWRRLDRYGFPFDENGVCVFERLPPGTYGVTVAFDAENRLYPRRVVEAVVVSGERTEVEVPVQEYVGVLSGVVVDPTGAPVAGARLSVRSAGSDSTKRTTAAGDGSFVIHGLPEVALDVWAHRPTFSDRTDEPLARFDGPREGVVVRLRPVFRLEGTVGGAPGESVSLAGHFAFLSEPRGAVFVFRGQADIRLDEDDPTRGTFTFVELLPGQYHVRIDRADVNWPLGGLSGTPVVIHEQSPDVSRVHVTFVSKE